MSGGITHENIAKLPRGDYRMESLKGGNKKLAKMPEQRKHKRMFTSVQEIVHEYQQIAIKASTLSFSERCMVVQRIVWLRQWSYNKSDYHTIIFPHDPTGEILAYLRS